MERENADKIKEKSETENAKKRRKKVTRKCCEGGERNSSQAHHKIT